MCIDIHIDKPNRKLTFNSSDFTYIKNFFYILLCS